MTDNIQNGEGVEANKAAWEMLCSRLQRDPATSEESDTCTLRVAMKAMVAFASARHSLAREPVTADVDAAIAIVRQHAAQIGVPSITVVAAPSSEPAIAEWERCNAAYDAADRTRKRLREIEERTGRAFGDDYFVMACVQDALIALAQSSTPPASKGVEA